MAQGSQPEIFQGRGGFVKLGHFNKHFVKNTRKKGAAGKIFGVYQCLFFQNQGTFFDFQKWQEGPSPSPLVARLVPSGSYVQKHLPEVFYWKRCCLQLYQKKTLSHMFSCEFCEFFKNTFLIDPQIFQSKTSTFETSSSEHAMLENHSVVIISKPF